jgi:Ni/Fe-hydrogenase subunit HybB-like protein
MATVTRAQSDSPERVGRVTPGWIIFFAVAGLAVILGLAAYAMQTSTGMIATNLRNIGTMGGATWGLYIVMVEYFIGVSIAGIVLAAAIRVFRMDELRSITRLAVLLTVVSLIVGLMIVLVDLGHPIRGIINMLLYARPQSPFFGTFTLVAFGVLFFSLAYLYLDGRRDAAIMADRSTRLGWFYRLWAAGYADTQAERARHQKVMFWMSIGIVPLIVVALSTEGLVFGIQVGRPGWYSSMQGPDFLVLAAASSLANLVVLVAIVQRVAGSPSRIPHAAFKWLGRFLLAAVVAALYFFVVELFTLLYATPGGERLLADELLRGSYAWIFWSSLVLMLAGLILLIFSAATRAWKTTPMVLASVLISTSVLAERYLTVIPSQTHGMLLPYEPGSYFPNWVEFAVVIGLFALGALLIGLFIKVFPVVPLRDEREVVVDA